MDSFYELLKLILPAGIVFLTTYYLVKNFLDHERNKKGIDLKLANQAILTPIRLQAYERVVLFLERINPSSMVMRLNKTGNSASFQGELLKTIRSEFEHNLSQQIYMSAAAWNATVRAKEETIKVINVSASKVNADSSALELAQAIVSVTAQLTEMPTKQAIDLIKKEISKEF
ncbi:MAG: hypothetical protein WCP52_07060 [Bacteroidota bacterium]